MSQRLSLGRPLSVEGMMKTGSPQPMGVLYWLHWSFILVTSLFTSILLITIRPYDSRQIEDFMKPTDSCPPPCFLGVRPGVTQGAEAQSLLALHEWVDPDSIYVAEDTTRQYLWINWSWSLYSPAFLTGTGYMTYSTLEDGTIRDILVRTRLRFGDVYLSLGAPDAGELNRLEHVGRYSDQWLFIRNPAHCGDFWRQRVSFYWFSPASLATRSRVFNLLDYTSVLDKRGCLGG
jgi:hypothetical protein